MTPYFIFLFILLLCTFARGVKGRDYIALLVFITMMLLCGLRGIKVGVDTDSYYGAYQHGAERFEPICQLLMWGCHLLGLSAKGFTMAMALMTYIPLFIFFKKTSKDICFSILIFLSFSVYFYHETFNTVRVYIAMAFSLFSYYYSSHGKVWKSLVFVLIATMSHYSAIATIPVMFFAHYLGRIRFWLMTAAIGGSVAFGFLFAVGFSDMAEQLSMLMEYYTSGDLANYYQKHLDTMEATEFNLVGTLSTMLPFSFFAIFMFDEQNAKSLYFKLFLIAVILNNVFISVVLTYRFTMFYTLLLTVLLPNSLLREKGFKKLGLIGLSSFMVLWYIYMLITATDGDMAGTIPYQL